MFYANCHPILIGSLPLQDYERAMQLILKYTPEIPLWPQLPQNPREGMIRQFLTGFPGLIDEGIRYWIDTGSQAYEQEMAAFYEDYMRAEEDSNYLKSSRFALGMDSAPGFFTMQNILGQKESAHLTTKGQVTLDMVRKVLKKNLTGQQTAEIIVKAKNSRDSNQIFFSTRRGNMAVRLPRPWWYTTMTRPS